MKLFGELVIPEFESEVHPVAVAQLFQEKIRDTGDDQQAAQIAMRAIKLITSSTSETPIPISYIFASSSVHLMDEPITEDEIIWNHTLHGEANLGGNAKGFNYVHTEKIRSICLGVGEPTIFTTDELRQHVIEYPESQVYLPVLAIEGVQAIEA